MKSNESAWRRHIQSQAKSALTIQDYCDLHRLTSGMFYYWKRKLSISADSSFHEIEILPCEHRTPIIEVHMGQGKLIRIEGPVSAAFLRELIQC